MLGPRTRHIFPPAPLHAPEASWADLQSTLTGLSMLHDSEYEAEGRGKIPSNPVPRLLGRAVGPRCATDFPLVFFLFLGCLPSCGCSFE